jgi:1-deoxyxylulose-5-phosphate synthase
MITSVILGAGRPDQLTATLAAAGYVLPDDLKSALDEFSVEYRRGDSVR